MKSWTAIVFVCCLALPLTLFADFQYQQTTQITGGSVVEMMKMMGVFSKQARQANEPITSMVYLKGNRMAHVNKDYTLIVDLDKETVTHIDHAKKQYTVMTFEQMRQQMQQAAEEMRKRRGERGTEPPPDMNFKVNVRNTGATKAVGAVPTKEAILTLALEGKDKQTGQTGALNMTNDMWMAPEVPGFAELRDFERRWATKMGMIVNQALSPQVAAMQPGMAQAMGDMVKEMSKLSGVPVLQVMRMGSTANGEPLPAASEAPLPPSQPAPSAGEIAKEGAKESIASKIGLGGLGGFGRKKKKEEEQPKEQPAGQQPQAVVLVESTTQMSDFSTASVSDGQFHVPADYKQVEPDLRRGR